MEGVVDLSGCLQPDHTSNFHATDLNYFHSFATLDRVITRGEFTVKKHLAKCCSGQGTIELHSRVTLESRQVSTVVVKRIPADRVNANKGKLANESSLRSVAGIRRAEDPLVEIGVFSYLSQRADLPDYILKMYVAFDAGDEIWLVLEHADEGDLFGVVKSGNLDDRHMMLWMWQMLQAVSYLHKLYIGHRDISLQNILLNRGDIRLMDFGQAVQTHSTDGQLLRYFTPAGKDSYRAPECYIPNEFSVHVIAPLCSVPGDVLFVETIRKDFMCHVLLPDSAVPGQVCSAMPCGYAVQPMDLFACGVSLAIMALGSPPWRFARPSDYHFKWTQANGVRALANAWMKTLPSGIDELLLLMLQPDPQHRLTARDCLAHPWFGPLETPGAFCEQCLDAGPFGEPYIIEVTRSLGDETADQVTHSSHEYMGAPDKLPLTRDDSVHSSIQTTYVEDACEMDRVVSSTATSYDPCIEDSFRQPQASSINDDLPAAALSSCAM